MNNPFVYISNNGPVYRLIDSRRASVYRYIFTVLSLFVFSSSFAETIPADTNRNAKQFVIRKIVLIGNKRTKDRILYRELIFKTGDTLNQSNLDNVIQKSKDNLSNTLLFNIVNIQHVEDAQDINRKGGLSWQGMDIYIFVTERWYIFPVPIFELADRNFNEWWETKNFARTNYGGYLYWNNFRGRNETVVLGVRLGYTQQVNISYTIPYINHNQHDGFGFSFSYNHNHEVGYQTLANQLDYFDEQNAYLKHELNGSVQYFHRQAIYNTYYFILERHGIFVSDTLLKLNPDYLAGNKTSEEYSTFRFVYRHDQRNNVNYPLTGNYFDVEGDQYGFSFLHDDIGFAFISSQLKEYWKISKKFYFASSIKGKISTDDFQPYYNIRALGYGSDYLRGYEYYVIDGEKFVLLKTDLKYELMSTHYFKADIIPSEKFSTIPYSFYFNLYADYGYVQDNQFNMYNPLANSNLYSFGAGIDFATYYNFVLRLEYSINKMGEKNIFVHFTAPI